MDAIRLVCPECDAVHRVKNITLGKLYRCKKCKAGLITMQPAVLVCPACGATRSPAHIEVSRLVTCDECEQMSLMNVRIAGVIHSGQPIINESEEGNASLLENIVLPTPPAHEEQPAETPNKNPVGYDTAIIRKIIAENATETSSFVEPTEKPLISENAVGELPENEFTENNHDDAVLSSSLSPPINNEKNSAALETPPTEMLLNEIRTVIMRNFRQTPAIPRLVWACLFLLLILYGWLLSSRDMQSVTLTETQKRLQMMEERAQKNFEEMMKVNQARIADLEAKIKTVNAEKRLLEADLQEYHRKINVMQKAYNRQFGIELPEVGLQK